MNIFIKSLSEPNFIVNMILHSLILFSFLSLFFAFFISVKAKETFKEELISLFNSSFDNITDPVINNIDVKVISELINNTIKSSNLKNINNNLNKLFNENAILLASPVLKNVQFNKLIKHFSKENSTIEAMNTGLMNNVLTINILLWSVFVIGIILLSKCYDIHIYEIIIENLLTFLIIGLAEFLFFTQIAANYIPIAPSFMTQQLLETVKNKLE